MLQIVTDVSWKLIRSCSMSTPTFAFRSRNLLYAARNGRSTNAFVPDLIRSNAIPWARKLATSNREMEDTISTANWYKPPKSPDELEQSRHSRRRVLA